MFFYIHIPFCRDRCPYCKFALTPVFDDFKKKRYIGYLKKEIRDYFSFGFSTHTKSHQQRFLYPKSTSFGSHTQEGQRQVDTIYLGGGTPSVLSLGEVQEILECFPGYKKAREVSFESNPEDITAEYIEGLFDIGITRLSLGVQTLNNHSLKEIHRSNRESILQAIEAIAPFDREVSLNVDFILGLPHVKKGETLANIQELHMFFPYITHTSVYMLEDEAYPKHWKSLSISESDMQDEFLSIMEYFKKQGWNHYELSNFAKPGYESVHNRAYWDHSEYRGFGLSASSFENGTRWSNSASFSGYYAGKIEGEESLTTEQIKIENMMFGFRNDGVDIDSLHAGKVATLTNEGLLEITNNKIKPTKTGIFLLDYIMGKLV